MTVSELAVGVLLALAVAVELLSCLGLLLMRNAFDRLHYLGPAATVGPVLVAAAVLVRHSSAQGCVKVVLLVMAVLAASAVLTPATARAARVRQEAREQEGPPSGETS